MQQSMRRTSSSSLGAPASLGDAAGALLQPLPPPAQNDSHVSSNRATAVKKSKSKKISVSNVIPVEYWISSAGIWTESAQLSINRNKNKLYINILDNHFAAAGTRWEKIEYNFWETENCVKLDRSTYKQDSVPGATAIFCVVVTTICHLLYAAICITFIWWLWLAATLENVQIPLALEWSSRNLSSPFKVH